MTCRSESSKHCSRAGSLQGTTRRTLTNEWKAAVHTHARTHRHTYPQTQVPCRETRLPPEVETDHVLVANTHRALIDDPRTLQLILSFMKHHKFPPDARRLPRREAT